MAQAIHLIALILLGVLIFYATVMAWMVTGFAQSDADRLKAYALWTALVVAFVLVLYNPTFLPRLLGSVPLPPNPLRVS